MNGWDESGIVGLVQARLEHAQSDLEKQTRALWPQTRHLCLQKEDRGVQLQTTVVVGGLRCGDAHVHLELGILSSWKV